jgi:hypothetical protein
MIKTGCYVLVGAWLLTGSALAQITVEGVQDRQITADKARFRVPAEAGFAYTCLLDGNPVPTGQWIEVNRPDYHELSVQRRSTATGAGESLLVRFIVRATERGDTERGLPPWTPYPVINASAEELAGAHVRLIIPRDYPLGLEIPVIAFVENEAGGPVRANGLLEANGRPAIQLRRGVGSGFLAATQQAGPMTYTARLKGLEVSLVVNLEANTAWQGVAGTLSGAVNWPADSRVAVTGALTIPAGASLTIGAGTIVRLQPGVDVVVSGRLVINGATERPVVFTPLSRAQPWGGFICKGGGSEMDATGAIFAGSGANPRWFDENSGYAVHRREQALLLLDGARATLTDCYLLEGHGQAGHGNNAYLTLTRCLVQKFITTGEYNGGSVQIAQSALLEFPGDDAVFADADNDGIYFTTGNHAVRDSLVGWAKDDGIDAGSGGAGSVTVSNCWVESCFHEAFAWSGGGRLITNVHCVTLNNGQGIEAGWSDGADSPKVFASDCLSAGNLTGARFGDNYDWTYNGFLRVTNSFLLFNYRNIWGLNWDDWTYRFAQMDLRGNYLSADDRNHPDNRPWQAGADGWRLAAFLTTPPGARVGLAFATRAGLADLSTLSQGLPVGLSAFSTNTVSVDYVVETPVETLAAGTLRFTPGETVKLIPLPQTPAAAEMIRVALANPAQAEFTGPSRFYYVRQPGATALVPGGSTWRYLDTGAAADPAWTGLDFSDAAWKFGPAELGFGDGDEATVVNGGPAGARFATTYFRHRFVVTEPEAFSELTLNLRRDDGAIVYLNHAEVFRSNMPTGLVSSATYTGQATGSETAFYSTHLPPALLHAGTNVVAVELHQSDRDSSDLSFELELIGVPVPRVGWQRFGAEFFLLWNHPGYGVERAESVAGPWRSVSVVPGPVDVAAPGAQFYRLRKR